MHPVGAAAVLAGVLAVAGCGASSTPAATFTEIYPLIFPIETKAQCNFCHGLPSNDKSNGKLSMGIDQPTAYAALMATSSSSMCGSGSAVRDLVVPGDADNSLLFQKLTTPPCGGRMPLGGSPLTAAELDQIRSWIEAGAKDD